VVVTTSDAAPDGSQQQPTTETPATGPDTDDARTGAADRHSGLRRRDIADLTAAEREEIRRLIALLAPTARRRPSIRRVPARTGRVDAARTVRLIVRNGGEPVRIARARRGWRPRRLLLLIDVSGSMAGYVDAALRFAHAAVAAGPTTTEVITVGTGWARHTDRLRGRDADAAMRAIAAACSDRGGGTTLGPALRGFLRRWGGRTAVRSAVIVFHSDGIEFGDPAELPRQVARLSRLGHTLIWVNPTRAVPGYEPLSPALTASLPYATTELTGHTFDSLRRLAEEIAR
jgi:uncharacterized protein with von Willebrand factor type A (vWA) domain